MLIAPCGLDCALCRSYIRKRNPCPGCRGSDSNKTKSCLACAIKNCKELAAGKFRFCFSCASYPCTVLRHLEDRYRARYGVSPISNLEQIKRTGVEDFMAEEISKWACPDCGSLLSMHKPECVHCGYNWQDR